MAQLHIFHIIGNGILPLGLGHHFIRRYVNELRTWIDKTEVDPDPFPECEGKPQATPALSEPSKPGCRELPFPGNHRPFPAGRCMSVAPGTLRRSPISELSRSWALSVFLPEAAGEGAGVPHRGLRLPRDPNVSVPDA
jgi:hypothetical protein